MEGAGGRICAGHLTADVLQKSLIILVACAPESAIVGAVELLGELIGGLLEIALSLCGDPFGTSIADRPGLWLGALAGLAGTIAGIMAAVSVSRHWAGHASFAAGATGGVIGCVGTTALLWLVFGRCSWLNAR